MRILLVEDDQQAARLASNGLREAGFLIDVAYSGIEGEAKVGATAYDVIVLDWLLTGKDGVTLCRDLRARGMKAPILMLTAPGALEERVEGLNAGADDCLTKPFAIKEMVARIHALLRRADSSRLVVLTVEDLSLYPLRREVTRAGMPLKLSPTEYAILEVLMRHAGEVLTGRRLGNRLWPGDDDFNNLIHVHMSHLRKKVDRPPFDPLIHTVWGRGYRLSAARR